MSDPTAPVTPPPPPQAPLPSGGLFAAPPKPIDLVPVEHRTLGMLCHLLALAGFLIPFGNIIGPLVLWLVKKDQIPFVNDQGKEAVNFQITVLIAAIAAGIVTICLAGLGALVVLVAGLVYAIIAAMKANNGEYYRYPFAIRLIK